MDYLKRRYTLTVKPIVIKIALRVLGSLAAVLGLSMLGFSLVFLSPITSMKPDLAFSIVVGALQILLGPLPVLCWLSRLVSAFATRSASRARNAGLRALGRTRQLGGSSSLDRFTRRLRSNLFCD